LLDKLREKKAAVLAAVHEALNAAAAIVPLEKVPSPVLFLPSLPVNVVPLELVLVP
jgi:hypothetical protein